MPKKLFYELHGEKRQKIITTSICEFAKHGYVESSTNSIVKNSGISKGSLFKYFENKEDLYFYLLDCVTTELTQSLDKKLNDLSSDLFERIIQYSGLEFSWYIQNPDKYNLIIKAFHKSDTDIYRKTEERFHNESQSIYYDLLEDVDVKQFKWDKQKVVNVLKWFLQGFNEDFIAKTNVQNLNNTQINDMKNEYVKSLVDYMEILKGGFL